MLKLRSEHLQAFSDLALEGFLERGVAYLRKTFPRQCEAAKDSDLRQWLRRCMARAEVYGLKSEYEVMCFVNATFLIGADFDTDAKHLWALELLMDKSQGSRQRADRLIEEARQRQ